MNTMTVFAALVAVSSVACSAAVPPKELLDARAVYDRAAHGPAPQINPTDLHTAKLSLDSAERAFEQGGDSVDARDLAYTAGRRAQIAEVRARGMLASAQKDRTVDGMHAATAAQALASSAELGRANSALASQGAQLQNEVERRQAAERRAAQAAAALARVASVTQEPRGMVITLSGGVLFTSGKADLLSSAQAKLNEIAEALIQQDPESIISIEGHTDAQGSTASNQDLSQRRAQAVREYLVSRGLSGARLTATGFGEGRSIGDNASAEGRANNRRVEIVVRPAR